ncbi:MAG: TOBE domain-containing protein [Sulfurovaceae bacterium]|nr:TOBE domain-containing protein [Sulfurovaceae bacterium]
MLTSARNCFYGKVGSIEKGVVSAEVSLSIGSEKIVATITNESLKRMKLGIDDTIYALVKSSSIILTKHKPTNISARNVITAKVDDVISGAVNT